GGGTSRNAGDDARPDLQLRLHYVPETRLPPAAVAAAGEYDLIEHPWFFLSCALPRCFCFFSFSRAARRWWWRGPPCCRSHRTIRLRRTPDCGPCAVRAR